eukprot:8289664-Alexandrium_andersonii.AAC.1
MAELLPVFGIEAEVTEHGSEALVTDAFLAGVATPKNELTGHRVEGARQIDEEASRGTPVGGRVEHELPDELAGK